MTTSSCCGGRLTSAGAQSRAKWELKVTKSIRLHSWAEINVGVGNTFVLWWECVGNTFVLVVGVVVWRGIALVHCAASSAISCMRAVIQAHVAACMCVCKRIRACIFGHARDPNGEWPLVSHLRMCGGWCLSGLTLAAACPSTAQSPPNTHTRISLLPQECDSRMPASARGRPTRA